VLNAAQLLMSSTTRRMGPRASFDPKPKHIARAIGWLRRCLN